MSFRNYFINCRGVDFFPSYESVWEDSGYVPTITSDFSGITESMESSGLKFAGATRISTWAHFNESEINTQLNYLKKLGINLIRVHLDLYAWAALGDKFISRIKKLARLAQDKKLYIQWVLFEADTDSDVSGVDALARNHQIGGYDPTTLEEAMASGLARYQRCPTVFNSELLTRAPSSMVVSGDSYFEAVVGAVSGYQSTLNWEAMANAYFVSSVNPADANAYTFVTSAVDKLNSIVPANQNVTTSFKYLTGDPANPNYSRTIINLCKKLDFICYTTDESVGYIKKHFHYLQALQAASRADKPLMVVNAGDWAKLNSLRSDIYDFSSIGIGFIADSIIDRNLSTRSTTSSKGIIYSDGEARNLAEVNALIAKASDDLQIKRSENQKLYDAAFNRNIEQKNFPDLDSNPIDELSYSNDNFTRFSTFGESEGETKWDQIRQSILNSPLSKTTQFIDKAFAIANGLTPIFDLISTTFSPEGFLYNSKQQGHSLAYYLFNIDSTNAKLDSQFLSLLNTLFINTGINYFTNPYLLNNNIAHNFDTFNATTPGYGDLARNQLAFVKIKILEELQKSLPIPELEQYTNKEDYPYELLSVGSKNLILQYYQPFAPSTFNWKTDTSSVIPYLPGTNYVSAITDLNLSATNKPLCYFNMGEGYASGSCYYSSTAAVSTDVTSIQNVLSKLDWPRYDNELYQWFLAIATAYVECANNFPDYKTRFNEIKESLEAVTPEEPEISNIELYEFPNENYRSSDFTVQILDNNIQYKSAYVFSATDYARAAYGADDYSLTERKNKLWVSGSYPVMSFLTFGTSASEGVNVKVRKTDNTFTESNVKIRPESKYKLGEDYDVDGGIVTIYSMKPLEKAWVYSLDDTSSHCFVFCDSYKPPIPTTGSYLYFAPGEHNLSSYAEGYGTTSIVSGGYTFDGVGFSSFEDCLAVTAHPYVEGEDFTIYIDGGAIVYGTLNLVRRTNVKLIGPGILHGGRINATDFHNSPIKTYDEKRLNRFFMVSYSSDNNEVGLVNGVLTYPVSGNLVSGITVVQTPSFTVHNPNVIHNIKCISPWMYSTDGPRITADYSTKVGTHTHGFYFLGDDAIIQNSPKHRGINEGGAIYLSSLAGYSTNNGPIVLSYGTEFVGTAPMYPFVIQDIDAASFSLRRNLAPANDFYNTYKATEVMIRGVVGTTFEGFTNFPQGWGQRDIVVSNVRLEDVTENPIFQIGNVPDPFVERGPSGSISGINFYDITVVSATDLAYYSIVSAFDSGWNRPSSIGFYNVKINNEYLTSGNYTKYFELLGGVSLTGNDLVFSSNRSPDTNIQVFPNPDPDTNSLRSSNYTVEVFDGTDYIDAHVYSGVKKAWLSSDAINPPWASGSYPVLSYLTFSVPSSTSVRISSDNFDITGIDIGPYRKNKNSQAEVTKGKAYIPINTNDKLWININNELSSPLFIFADQPYPSYEDIMSQYPGYKSVVFTTGVYDISDGTGNESAAGYPNRYKITDSSTVVYIPPGAYIRGNFNISAVSGVKFIGQGVLSLENFDWWGDIKDKSDSYKYHYAVFFNTSSNSFLDWRLKDNVVSGLTVINTPFYFNQRGSLQEVYDLKFISPWNYNTDGPKLGNYYNQPKGSKLLNSFIYTADDVSIPSIMLNLGNHLTSGCYVGVNHNSFIANYVPGFLSNNFSASITDIDVRAYTNHDGRDTPVIKIYSDTTVTTIPSTWKGLTNTTISSINIENPIETLLFGIGNITYPFGNVPPYGNRLGAISGILFADISATEYTGAGAGVYFSSNIISGLDSVNKPYNLTFKNVIMNGEVLNSDNYTNYFTVTGSVDVETDNILFVTGTS